jgi:hypothetical protein
MLGADCGLQILGTPMRSTLFLDPCIGNDDGTLVWEVDGYFGYENLCNCRSLNGTVMTCTCMAEDGSQPSSSIDLDVGFPITAAISSARAPTEGVPPSAT